MQKSADNALHKTQLFGFPFFSRLHNERENQMHQTVPKFEYGTTALVMDLDGRAKRHFSKSIKWNFFEKWH